MKNSGVEWIGEIPEDWEVKKLKYICDPLASGGTPDSNNDQYYCENGTNWVAINDMSLVDYVENTAKHITNLAINEKKLKIYPKGTIIYSIYATLGHVAELSKPACINQALLALSIKDKSFNKSYFKYSLNAMKEYILAFSSGNTQFNLNAQKVRNFTLLTPSFETQQRIASYLDKKCSKIEETIQNQQQVIERLKAYKQSLITEAVTGKIKIQNGKVCGKYESYKDSDVEWIGKIPKGWETPKIQYISTISSGTTPNRSQPKYWNGDVNWIKTGELQNNRLFEVEEKITQTAVEECSLQILPLNTVLIAMYGQGKTRGMTALLKTPSTTNQACAALIVNSKKLSSDFLWHCLIGAYNAIRADAEGSGQPNLNSENIKKFHITLPSSIEEQECICNYLDKKCTAIDIAIEQKQKLIEKLTEYKKSLIYECVTGKKEIS